MANTDTAAPAAEQTAPAPFVVPDAVRPMVASLINAIHGENAAREAVERAHGDKVRLSCEVLVGLGAAHVWTQEEQTAAVAEGLVKALPTRLGNWLGLPSGFGTFGPLAQALYPAPTEGWAYAGNRNRQGMAPDHAAWCADIDALTRSLNYAAQSRFGKGKGAPRARSGNGEGTGTTPVTTADVTPETIAAVAAKVTENMRTTEDIRPVVAAVTAGLDRLAVMPQETLMHQMGDDRAAIDAVAALVDAARRFIATHGGEEVKSAPARKRATPARAAS